MTLAYAGAQGLRELGASAVDKAAEHAPKFGKGLWEFLNKPFVATVTGSTASGLIVMYINNKWSPGKETPSQCSTLGQEADVIKGSVKEVTYFADIEAVEIILTLPDGKISTISMAATKKGNAAECGIPATGDKKT